MKNPRSVFAILLLFALPAFGGFSATESFLPAVGRVAGSGGSQFYTTVWLTNPAGSGTAHFTFQFLQQGKANTGAVPSFADTLAPGETKIYENVIEQKLHLTSAIGAARITSDLPLVASERIYNQASPADNLGTTEGLFFAAVPSSLAIGAGETASVQGVNQGDPSENMRYNFALVETTGQPVTAHVVALNDLGANIGAVDFPLLPYEQLQPNVGQFFPAVHTVNARLVATVASGAGKFILAGAQLANVSQDSSGFAAALPYPGLAARQTISVGHAPAGLAFDGSNVWVANDGANTVQKIPISTRVPGPPIAVGSEPYALAFDGTNVWVDNEIDGTLQKIPAATGVPGPPIHVGHSPEALVFDGANIWVANTSDATVQKIPVASGAPGPPIPVGSSPVGLAFDGANVWVACFGAHAVQKIPVATSVAGSPIPVSGSPWAVAFDGASIWVANLGGSNVQRIPVATGVPGAPIPVGTRPYGLTFDGANIWVADDVASGTVTPIPVATGVPGSAIPAGNRPEQFVFDGANVWVSNFLSNNVQIEGFAATETFLPAVGRVAGSGGSQFYTAVWLTNPSSTETVHFTFQLLEQGQANVLGAPSFAAVLAPGETRLYENLVEGKLHLSNTLGAGRIVADGEIDVSERIYNQANPGDDLGTTEGLFFAGVAAPYALRLGQSAFVQGVNQGDPSENMRYNFALVETAGLPVTVHVALVDNLGAVLGGADYPLLPYEQIQPNVAALFPAISTINARLVATVTSGTGRVILAGAQLANVSQDSSGFEMTFTNRPAE